MTNYFHQGVTSYYSVQLDVHHVTQEDLIQAITTPDTTDPYHMVFKALEIQEVGQPSPFPVPPTEFHLSPYQSNFVAFHNLGCDMEYATEITEEYLEGRAVFDETGVSITSKDGRNAQLIDGNFTSLYLNTSIVNSKQKVDLFDWLRDYALPIPKGMETSVKHENLVLYPHYSRTIYQRDYDGFSSGHTYQDMVDFYRKELGSLKGYREEEMEKASSTFFKIYVQEGPISSIIIVSNGSINIMCRLDRMGITEQEIMEKLELSEPTIMAPEKAYATPAPTPEPVIHTYDTPLDKLMKAIGDLVDDPFEPENRLTNAFLISKEGIHFIHKTYKINRTPLEIKDYLTELTGSTPERSYWGLSYEGGDLDFTLIQTGTYPRVHLCFMNIDVANDMTTAIFERLATCEPPLPNGIGKEQLVTSALYIGDANEPSPKYVAHYDASSMSLDDLRSFYREKFKDAAGFKEDYDERFQSKEADYYERIVFRANRRFYYITKDKDGITLRLDVPIDAETEAELCGLVHTH